MLTLRRLMSESASTPIPAGPLAVRWLGYRLPEFRAGAEAIAEVVLQNAGTATWRPRGELGVKLSHHWLDDRGNAIIWDSPHVDFGARSAGRRGRGGAARARAAAAGPLPARVRPRRGASLLVRRDRLPRARAGRRGAAAHRRAATRSRRPRRRRRRNRGGAGGAGGGTRRSRRDRDGTPRHRRGAGARLVAPDPRRARRGVRRRRRLDRVAGSFAPALGPGGGRNPAFSHPLLLPSLLAGLAPGEHEGLPAYVPDGEPAIFDGRIRLRLPRGRRRA